MIIQHSRIAPPSASIMNIYWIAVGRGLIRKTKNTFRALFETSDAEIAPFEPRESQVKVVADPLHFTFISQFRNSDYQDSRYQRSDESATKYCFLWYWEVGIIDFQPIPASSTTRNPATYRISQHQRHIDASAVSNPDNVGVQLELSLLGVDGGLLVRECCMLTA
jgi:hypothetical protein